MCRPCCEYHLIQCRCPSKGTRVGYTVPCCRNVLDECDPCIVHPGKFLSFSVFSKQNVLHDILLWKNIRAVVVLQRTRNSNLSKKMFSIITFCSAVVSLQAAVYLRIVKPATMEHGELMMTSSWMGSIVLSAVKAGVEGIVKVSKCFNEVFLWGLTKLQKCLILWIIFLNVIADRKTEIMQSLHYEVKMNRSFL